MEELILVDENDKQIGTMEKLQAHKKGLRHRCFSIQVFNKKKELLIQRRALDKYHCGGLWTNTCCSHQRLGEETIEAAHRRLKEEMGFDTKLEEKFIFQYRAEFNNGLTEHEVDHVLTGYFQGEPRINKEEVAEYKWISLSDLKKDVDEHPEKYTPWFKMMMDRLDENGKIL